MLIDLKLLLFSKKPAVNFVADWFLGKLSAAAFSLDLLSNAKKSKIVKWQIVKT